jgi:leucyl aminopeptidase (aminopeptidase T)
VLTDRPVRRTLAGPSVLETRDASGEHGRSLAELGIGTNPAATLTGNMLADEKVIDTMRLAFDTSAGIGVSTSPGCT